MIKQCITLFSIAKNSSITSRYQVKVLGFFVVIFLTSLLHTFKIDVIFDYKLMDIQFDILDSLYQQKSSGDIVIVGINEETVAHFQEPLALWHKHLGIFCAAMAKAMPKALGLNVVLPDRSYANTFPGFDQQLLAGLLQLRDRVPVVLAETVNEDGSLRQVYPAYISIAGGIDAIGSTALPLSLDRVVRLFSEEAITTGEPIKAMAGQLARKLGKNPSSGWINYAHSKQFTYTAFHLVLQWYQDGNYQKLQELFKDKVVLVGAVLPITDRHYSPHALAAWEQNDRVPSVLIHAQILHNIINDDLIHEVPFIVTWLLAFVGILMWFILFFTRPVFLMLTAWLMSLFLLSIALLSQGWLLPVSLAMSSGIIAVLVILSDKVYEVLREAHIAQEKAIHKERQLNQVGVALSNETDTDCLLEIILDAAQELANADAGTIYCLSGDKNLSFRILRTRSLGIAVGGSSGKKPGLSLIPLYNADNTGNLKTVVAYSVLKDQTVNIDDAYKAEGFDFTGTKAFDKKMGYHSKSFLTIPMKNHEQKIIGVLQLINATDCNSHKIIPFCAEAQELTESLASQAAIALTKQLLIDDLRKLFESFTQSIATAIDDKSPYTGGHCNRVPVLADMLARAASASDIGDIKDFKLSEEKMYELKVAAWLHDCGKVTTPLHVVDKATKLETVFDRIHLISVRFEILKRDAEIAMLRNALESGFSGENDIHVKSEQKLAKIRTRIDEDRNFIAECNIGGEFMIKEHQERVKNISQYTWVNANGEVENILSEDEVYNINIPSGTINKEERETINHHVIASIKMLEALNFPQNLSQVPKIAGGHHERLDGKGYPYGLTKERLSIQARILAIADVFEALTARDRPYKKGKTLSEALKILGLMKNSGHIDPDLFQIFIDEGIFRDYAKEFLKEEQIDEVLLENIPGYVTIAKKSDSIS